MNNLIYLWTIFISFIGGLLQAVTGFGAGIMIMLIMPNVLPMNIAPAVSNTICTPLSWSIAIKYRKYADFKKTIIPVIVYLFTSTVAIQLSTMVNLNGLKAVFGGVLIALSLYFLFFARHIKVKGTAWSAVVCCSISGILSGFFGIGGPLMVLYFLAVTKEKEEYLGTINAVFSITTVYQVVVRICIGILTWEHVPVIGVGIAAILLGRVLGSKIVDKLDGERMKKIIYIFLMIAGAITIVQAL